MGTKPSAFTVVTSLAGDEGIPVITDLDGTPGNGIADLQLVSGWAVIGQTVLGSSAASISFTSIPATYEALKLVVHGRTDRAATTDGIGVRFNNDSAANYDASISRLTNTTYLGVADAGGSMMYAGRLPAASAAANQAGTVEVLIPGYARTVFQKAANFHAAEIHGTTAATMQFEVGSGLWRSTAAINRVDFGFGVGSLITGTVATLYGLRGA